MHQLCSLCELRVASLQHAIPLQSCLLKCQKLYLLGMALLILHKGQGLVKSADIY